MDWNKLWQDARTRKTWKKKKKGDWDRRAAGFAKRNRDSDYAEQFLQLMKPQSHWRVLDVGCGPGTLAIPMAGQVKSVTALDFSSAMLNELRQKAIDKKISNVYPLQACWTDNWLELDIQPHEVAVSSRSLSVFDLKGALEKLNSWALEKVFIADRLGSGPFDPDLFAALNRPFDPGPDYIFTVNILYQMGIHPSIDYIEVDSEKTFRSRDEAVAGCRWMFDDLSPAEEKNLAAFVDERLEKKKDGHFSLKRRLPVKWAFISWNK